MYSWIIIFIESKIIDLIIDGSSVKTMMIVSEKMESIKEIIIKDLGRGATLIPAIGMYKGEQRNIIYTTMTRREMITLRYKIAK